MNRIDKQNAALKVRKKKAFVAYITAGFPDSKTTAQLVPILEKNGADFIELGMPFSDPIADGPIIQAASMCALDAGMTVKKFLALVRALRRKTEVPLIMMSYYNPIFHYGIQSFARDAARAGLDGVIVPDLPPEEAQELNTQLQSREIAQIFLISPVTQEKRIKKIARMSTGFVYYVSLTGVTGASNPLPKGLAKQVRTIKRYAKIPVFVGFGVSTAAQVKPVLREADGVIVGSAIVAIIKKYRTGSGLYKQIGAYIASMNRQTQ